MLSTNLAAERGFFSLREEDKPAHAVLQPMVDGSDLEIDGRSKLKGSADIEVRVGKVVSLDRLSVAGSRIAGRQVTVTQPLS